MDEQIDFLIDEVLPLAMVDLASRKTQEVDSETGLKAYDARLPVQVADGRYRTGWHCTELVYNTAWELGFSATPVNGSWIPTSTMISDIEGQAARLGVEVEVIWSEAEDGEFSKKHHAQVRPGDILLWGPKLTDEEGYGHHMVIVDTLTTVWYREGLNNASVRLPTHSRELAEHPTQETTTPDLYWVSVAEAGASVQSGDNRPINGDYQDAPKRDAAIYRLTSIDGDRLVASFEAKPELQALLLNAYEQALLRR